MTRVVAGTAVAVGLTCTAFSSVGAAWLLRSGVATWETTVGILLAGTGLVAVGSVLVLKLHSNVIGWLLLASGSLWGSLSFAEAYARSGVVAGAVTERGPTAALWFATWNWLAATVLLVVVLLVFPDGELPSRRWRPVGWAMVTGAALVLVAQWFDPWGPTGYTYDFAPRAENPLHIAAAEPARQVAASLGALLLLPAGALAIASVAVRFRRSRHAERQQMKWFVLGVGGALGLHLLAGLFVSLVGRFGGEMPVRIEGATFLILLLSFPVAIGVAVLRYRLYEIDRVVNRTIVYAIVTGVLVTAYAGAVMLLQPVLHPLTGGSDLAVAASTLGVAALFGPVRRRVQHAVDRRFDRAHYDAAQEVETFGRQLRDEIDLVRLGEELRRVVERSIQPQHVHLWLPEETHP